MLADDSFIVSIQNGLNEPIIADHVGVRQTVGCFVHFAADYLEPGLLQLSNERTLHIGHGWRDHAEGQCPGGDARPCNAGRSTTDNIWGYLWGKMTWAGMAFVTACIDAPVYDVVNHPLGQKLCRLASTEVYNVPA
ncbi:MAG: hypothetical protein R3A46_10790 [Thermomicrobiales bacterium]